MLSSRRPDLHQQPPQIINDEKFFMRLLSKETSASSSSFRIYYGVSAAGAVPFRWESRPGTPKHATSPSALPPLTPPPSFHSFSSKTPSKSPKHKLISFHSLLPWLNSPKKPHWASPSPPSSSSSSSSSTASSSLHRRGRYSCSRSSSSFNSKSCDEGFCEELTPAPTLCSGQRRRSGGKGGCHSMGVVKSMLLAIVGHGSA